MNWSTFAYSIANTKDFWYGAAFWAPVRVKLTRDWLAGCSEIRECLKLDPDHKACFAHYKVCVTEQRRRAGTREFAQGGSVMSPHLSKGFTLVFRFL
jgi:hypothetical protein